MTAIQTTLLEKPETNNHTAKSYTGIYSMHKYWSKKPSNIIRDFILKYSKINEIVVDPFCGSGISITESIFTKRKAIGIDINPSAIFITRQMLTKVSSKELASAFKIIESKCRDEINKNYLVVRDGKSYIGTHYYWENGTLSEVWFNKGKTKIVEKPLDKDIELANSFKVENIHYYYPKRNLFHNSRINAKREQHVYDLFTPRNLTSLSLLLNEINNIPDEKIRDVLKFNFTSSMGQASKMVFAVTRRGKNNGKERATERKEVGSWVIGYWIPKENFEINAWNCFENRFKRILKAKKEQEGNGYLLAEAKSFDDLQDENNLLLMTESAISGLKKIPNDSVDYVITDPPHGNRIPYLELSMMWNEWLGNHVNYEDELIVSESKDRTKNLDNYNMLLKEALKQIERVLKPNKYFSFMFNSIDDDTWIDLVNLLNSFSFDLEKVETLGYSANSVVQDNREGGLKTDFIFTFKKNTSRIHKEIELLTLDKNKDFIHQKIDDCINSSKNGLEIYEILNYLVTELLKKSKFFKLSEVLDIIKSDYTKLGNKWQRKEINNGSK